LIISTISAFYFGETLQAKRTSALSVASMKIFFIFSSLSIIARVEPPKIKAVSFPSYLASSNDLIASLS